MLPVSYAGEPRRATAAGEAFRPTSFEVHSAIPVEHLALPDFLNCLLVCVWEKFGSTKRDILATQGNASQRVDIETFKWPDARLFLHRRQVRIQMFIQSTGGRNRGVVIPRP